MSQEFDEAVEFMRTYPVPKELMSLVELEKRRSLVGYAFDKYTEMQNDRTAPEEAALPET